MELILLVVHLLLALALVSVILMQRSEGGALGIGGGPGGMMSARGAANLLTKATGWLAVAFLATSMGLAILARGGQVDRTVLDEAPIGEEADERPAVPIPDE